MESANWKIADEPHKPDRAAADCGSLERLLSQTNTTKLAVPPMGMVSRVSKWPYQEPAVADVELLKPDGPPEAATNWLKSATVEAA